MSLSEEERGTNKAIEATKTSLSPYTHLPNREDYIGSRAAVAQSRTQYAFCSCVDPLTINNFPF